ncbi:MAG TPA: hypothetical protein VFO42_03290 [Sphingomicrobium sp.]|nr:hypothetical protein [Sphingomicrobium sp.]
MRAFVVFTAGAAMFLAGCSGNGPDENASGNAGGPEDRFVVRAGPVANAQLGALSGTFQMLKSGAPDAIPSGGTGGACLVFAAADLGFTQMAANQCTTNLQCSTNENPVGYCDTGTGTCWSRPNRPNARAALCNAGITLTPNALTPVPVQPSDAGQFGVAPGAKVRVVACLNKGSPPWPNNRAPCAYPDHSDRIEVLGPVTTVR